MIVQNWADLLDKFRGLSKHFSTFVASNLTSGAESFFSLMTVVIGFRIWKEHRADKINLAREKKLWCAL